jgi:predicted acylesterase/phospholipase RssA
MRGMVMRAVSDASTTPGGVLAVAGRRIDPLDKTEDARFPAASAAIVKAGVKRILRERKIGRVVASAACGTDILALEAAVELELVIRIVLPFERERFRKSSVVDRGEEWGRRFDALLDGPNPSRELVVVALDADANDAAYAAVTARLITDANRFGAEANSNPVALAVWDNQPRANADATKDFIEQASNAGLEVLTLSTLPQKLAAKIIAGGEADPHEILDLAADLGKSEPLLAHQIVRKLALAFLQAKKKLKTRAVDRLWKACKEVEAFAFARRILKRRLDDSPQIIAEQYPGQPSELTLRQQRALCTSKDPDLSAAMRHDWALKILRPNAEPTDREHQGIAGGIWKRRWEWDGSRASLEQALEHYRKGSHPSIVSRDGYTEINYAFVLDLLASLVHDASTSKAYSDEADAVRKRVVANLSDTSMWACGSLAEADLGLARLDDAKAALVKYAKQGPAPWEKETTLRQLVRLAALRGIAGAALGPVLAAAFNEGNPRRQDAVTSVLVGRVGLALSGGGFRASLYHLGVLARLAESDVLRHVEVLSCVSGGSIIGAQYYLRLRKELNEKGEELTRADYVRVVREMIASFVRGVERNVRTQVLASFRNSYAIVTGDDETYASGVAQAFQEAFYAELDPSGSRLHELLVRPKERPDSFHPGWHNWTRKNKVPVLVLNATTLNTGHSWQFTARSMGESPFSVQPAIDSNPRLRRPNYHPSIPDRSVLLCDAVAASACVPGLFAPMQLDGLYPGYKVRLVDGGVYDNQGAAGLVEQDCQVLFVSDAAGQLLGESSAGGGHVSPLKRSFSVFQERIRQTGYESLIKRREAGQLRGLAYTHLTQGLGIAPVDWAGCEDPVQPDDQLPDDSHAGAGTGDGVDKTLQLSLAKMRTDLDVFSEIECAALMASGYAAMGPELERLFLEIPALDALRDVQDWFFSRVLLGMQGREQNPAVFERLREHLGVSAALVGRSVKLNARVRVVFIVLAVLLVGAVVALVWHFQTRPLITVGGAGLLALGLVLPFALGDWLDVVLDPSRAWRVPLRNFVAALALTLYAKIVLNWVDPSYVRDGRLAKLFEAK